MTGPDSTKSQPAGITLNLRTVSMGLAGLGGLLIALGFTLWLVNKPNYGTEVARRQQHYMQYNNRPMSSREQAELMRQVADAESNYRSCLFSTRIAVCELAPMSPLLNIGGALVLMAGGGLFFMSRRRKPA